MAKASATYTELAYELRTGSRKMETVPSEVRLQVDLVFQIIPVTVIILKEDKFVQLLNKCGMLNNRLEDFVQWMDKIEEQVKDLDQQSLTPEQYKDTISRFKVKYKF